MTVSTEEAQAVALAIRVLVPSANLPTGPEAIEALRQDLERLGA